MNEIIYEEPNLGLSMCVDRGYSKPFVNLLHNTIWGTQGLLYYSHDIEQELKRIPNFYMIRLLRGETLVGVYGLAEKIVSVKNVKISAFHRLFLAVDQKYHGNGYGKLLVKHTRRHFLDNAKNPTMLYGYIEAQNSRSLALSKKVRYQCIGSFQSIVFNRFHPQQNPAIKQASNSIELLQLLEKEYKEFALVDIKQSFIPSEYYYLKRNGTIVAGLQVHPKRFSLVALEGWHGKLVLRLLPRIPYLKHLMPNGELDFLSIGNIYCTQDHGKDFFNLVEGVLALYKTHVAIAFVDCDSPVLSRLRKIGKFGMLSKLVSESLVHVTAGFHQIKEDIITEFIKRPLFISPLDPS
jgi:GNAT superfamily N-acetyltransferase